MPSRRNLSHRIPSCLRERKWKRGLSLKISRCKLSLEQLGREKEHNPRCRTPPVNKRNKRLMNVTWTQRVENSDK